ncbi:MAG: hypothetical protein NT075_23455, partial [Chloroflexi bacterium]|nr:hypothetical protein [Chloroflexota bacterium]
AEESTQITLLDGETIQLDATFACPDFTFTLQSPTFGADHINGVELVQQGSAQALVWDAASDGQMPSTSWRQTEDRITVCFDLRPGTQSLRLCR